MKLVTAVIQPYRFEAVRDALMECGISGLTISEVTGHGRQGGHTEVYRGAEYRIDAVPKTRIEILVEDRDEPAVVETIVAAARTGRIGDGKVWSVDVSRVVRVRTGETGDDAV